VEKQEWTVKVPEELKEDLESFARVHFDGETWKMLAEAQAALHEDKFTETDVIMEKVRQLEEQLEVLKALVNEEEQEEDGLKPTLGP